MKLPPVDTEEALRYAQGGRSKALRARLIVCLEGLEFSPRIVYTLLDKEEFFKAIPSLKGSMSLTKLLDGCEKAVLFAATVGMAFDYALERKKHLSLADAELLQGIGAERIEALCDEFCKGFGNATKRVSPGYGDIPLEAQREIFNVLRPEKIGVSLTDSLMMTPSKSVTAIFGLKK